jgi:rare lipoprotein A
MKKTVTIFTFSVLIAVSAGAQTPLPENGGFRQEGLASWYGEEFAGRPTASGEPFDPARFTAAHPTLEFGTVLTITNLLNNKQVKVVVNDKGPFAGGRIIDVSRAAAEKLDMLDTGVATVLIEVVPRYAGAQGVTAVQAAPEAPPLSAVSGSGEESGESVYYPVPRPAIPAAGTEAGGANTASQRAPAPSGTVSSSSVMPMPAPPPPRAVQPVPTASSAGSIPATSAPKNIPAPTAGTPRPADPADPARSSITRTNPPSPAPQANTPAPVANNPPAAVTPQQIQPVQTGAVPPNPSALSAYQPLPPVAPVLPLPPPPTVNPAPSATAAPQSPPATPPVPGAAAPRGTLPNNVTNPLTSTPPATPADPGVNIKPQSAPAEIKGGPIVPGRVYRLQIGSYKTPRNAVATFDRLSNAGLNPSWEPFGEYYRIVLTNVKSEDIPAVADKLGQAGFKEAVARIEAYEE